MRSNSSRYENSDPFFSVELDENGREIITISNSKLIVFWESLGYRKVVNDNGSKPSIARIMLRTLLYVIPFLLYMIPLLAVFWYLPLFSKKSTVYDSLSRTRVVGD